MSLETELEHATVEEILLALKKIESSGRPGLRYDIVSGLFMDSDEPSKEFPGPDPMSFYQNSDFGVVTISGWDPHMRTEAITLLRKENNCNSIQANAALVKLGSTPIEMEFWNKKEAQDTLSHWVSHGFIGTLSGFGETKQASSHVRYIRQYIGPQAA